MIVNPAYQVSGFAYQGNGQFAYQGRFSDTPAADGVHGGKGDNKEGEGIKKRKKLSVYKPTGLPPIRPARGETAVDLRVAETIIEIAREIDAASEIVPITQMSLAAIEREISALMRMQVRTDQEEAMLLILLAAYGD